MKKNRSSLIRSKLMKMGGGAIHKYNDDCNRWRGMEKWHKISNVGGEKDGKTLLDKIWEGE